MPFEEARALEGIGHSYLHDGSPRQAARQLRQALAIYQRTDTPGAQRVQQLFHQLWQARRAAQPPAPNRWRCTICEHSG